MPSQAGRRLLLAAAAAQGYEVESWDVHGAHMRPTSEPRFRLTVQHPRADGLLVAPDKMCVLRKVMAG